MARYQNYWIKTLYFFFNFIFKLYIIVLVLPNIKMNPPQVYMYSPSWTLLPPPSPYHLSFKKKIFKWPKIGPESLIGLLYFFAWLKKLWRREIEKMTWMTKRDGLLHSSSSTLNERDHDTHTEQPWLLNKDKNYFQKKHLHHRCLV